MRALLLLLAAAAAAPAPAAVSGGVELVTAKTAPLEVGAPAATEPEALAEKEEHEEDPHPYKKYTRWLWWLLIVYMFYAQATICDEYFVESIKVVVDKYGIPDDVAGATLMALGCNGPELFTNFISIFVTKSDVGVGTIVGSEIFNVLCIIGGAIVYSPILPMMLKKVSFIRDCSFYFVSILLLAWTLQDNVVTFFEASVLCMGCVVFATTVALTAPAMRWLKWEDTLEDEVEPDEQATKSDEVCVELEPHGLRMPAARSTLKVSADEHGILLAQSSNSHRSRRSLVTAEAQGLSESLLDGGAAASMDIGYDKVVAVHDMGKDCIEVQVRDEWGSTVAMELHAGSAAKAAELKAEIGKYTDVTAVKSGASKVLGEFGHSMRASDVPAWYKITLVVTVPVDLVVAFTVGWCDVRVPSQRHRWPQAFCCAMIWLAIFSYIMCVAADGLHEGFGISQAVLGVTICAVGTSFPNFWASLLMAKAGRADMAVANALGSNVQNVFLALAVPWMCRIVTQDYAPFEVSGDGIFTGVLWMGGTLAFVFFAAVLGGWSYGKPVGYSCFAVYLVYVLVATHVIPSSF